MSNLTYTAETSTNLPLQDLSSTNHGPWLLALAYIFLALSLTSTFIKLFSRYKLTGRLTAHDVYIVASSFFALFQTITITIAIRQGLGRHQSSISTSSLESFEKAYYASNLVLLPALAAAKASVVHLVVDIFPQKRPQLLCYGSLGLTAAWAFASIFALAFQCSLPRPWEAQGNKCVNRFGVNIGVHTLNILTDLLLTLIPLVLIQQLQVSPRKRWVLRGLFACRLSVSVFTILMLTYMRNIYRSANVDFTWEALMPQVWAQIMLNASIITACMPSFKPLLQGIRPTLPNIQIPAHELTATSYARPSTSGSRIGGPKSSSSPRLTAGFNRSSASTRRSNTTTSRVSTSSKKSKSRAEKQQQAIDDMERGHNRPRAAKVESRIEHGRSESNQCLTDDVILRYIDYRVEYEDVLDDLDMDQLERAERVQ